MHKNVFLVGEFKSNGVVVGSAALASTISDSPQALNHQPEVIVVMYGQSNLCSTWRMRNRLLVSVRCWWAEIAGDSASPDVLARTMTSSVSTIQNAVNTAISVAPVEAANHKEGFLVLTMGSLIVGLIGFLPGILYRVITFSTYTMPTFLFTLFSTSLTFTMNATTLYVIYRGLKYVLTDLGHWLFLVLYPQWVGLFDIDFWICILDYRMNRKGKNLKSICFQTLKTRA